MSAIFFPHPERYPSAAIEDQTAYQTLCAWAKEDYEGFWAHHAKEWLVWQTPFTHVLDRTQAPFYQWFVGGQLNVSEQCLDQHLAQRSDQVALLFEGEKGDRQSFTYRELFEQVCQAANLLCQGLHVTKGDRVILYMPLIPEAIIMMLACARIGAIHSIVFGGFSAEALYERIEDAQAKVIITADGGYRRGQAYPLKSTVDQALMRCESGCVSDVLVVRRTGCDVAMVSGRDSFYDERIQSYDMHCDAAVLESEDPLFILYTSGSTGKPKGVLHSQAGYILWAQMTLKWVFDLQENDIFWCTADIGWITGHTYTVYGPLALGKTTLIYEGVPTYPDAGRFWDIIAQYGVTQFYTAPTAIRLLHKEGAEQPHQFDLSSLRVLGSVGEPINPEAWEWYYHVVGRGQCSVVDTWWQTETGGHMITPLPAWTPMKPGCATQPLPGVQVAILDAQDEPVAQEEKGALCITQPWPSMIRSIWGDPERYIETYFMQHKGEWFYRTGDGAFLDDQGDLWVTGRVDDVMNVSGHRLGTAEIEASLAHYPCVAEVAVVSIPDQIKGEGVVAFTVLKSDEDALRNGLNQQLKKDIGPIAVLEKVWVVPALPKTRSGKIMRRLLRAIARGEPVEQDISTLEDTDILEELQKAVGETTGFS